MQFDLSHAGLNQSTVSFIPRQAGVQKARWRPSEVDWKNPGL